MQHRSWLWYGSKTILAVPLDPMRYESMIFDGWKIPRPGWMCQAPNGGIHIDARVGRIDVHVASEPARRVELNWTKPYSVTIVKSSWFDLVADLINPALVFVGDVLLKGSPLEGCKTLHGIDQPPLLAARMETFSCPICGEFSTWPITKPYFVAPDIGDELLIVNGNGVFVREDVAIERHLRRPNGSYKPTRVVWKPKS